MRVGIKTENMILTNNEGGRTQFKVDSLAFFILHKHTLWFRLADEGDQYLYVSLPNNAIVYSKHCLNRCNFIFYFILKDLTYNLSSLIYSSSFSYILYTHDHSLIYITNVRFWLSFQSNDMKFWVISKTNVILFER